ncbi:MAG: bifunctional diaminohydroxyphosphoribosylaminopyrimidine deaminase/5-amino-6-(5-phosphoribosylamino)uracil reductase RibD [Sporolactobacillus sp.]
MRLALDLSRATHGQTHPNPAVGAVVVSRGAIVGIGAHLRAGEAHAEVHALRMAGARAEGATLYVTLEPCAHVGRTPPCADLIIKKRLQRVVIASHDPNPLVAGKGIARMRAAGITVETGVLREEADAVNADFFHFMRTHRPWVTLKIAASLDGKTATCAGESKWITGEDARRDGHVLRQQHDAVLVGIGTVLADDPRLTVRVGQPPRQPVRVVLDTMLRIPESAQLLTDHAAPTWLFTGTASDACKAERLRSDFVRVFRLRSERVAVADVLATLADNEILSVLVEGGAAVRGSFLTAGLFDRVVSYVAPSFIGGTEALSSVGGSGIARLADLVPLRMTSVRQLGTDIRLTAEREGESECLPD